MKNITLYFSPFLFFSLLSACSHQKVLLEADAPTMKEIFEHKFNTRQGITRSDIERTLTTDACLDQETANLQQQFPFLPNPVMALYIYPHLTTAGTPVPGYSTYFKFYEKDHAAIPEEKRMQEDQ